MKKENKDFAETVVIDLFGCDDEEAILRISKLYWDHWRVPEDKSKWFEYEKSLSK